MVLNFFGFVAYLTLHVRTVSYLDSGVCWEGWAPCVEYKEENYAGCFTLAHLKHIGLSEADLKRRSTVGGVDRGVLQTYRHHIVRRDGSISSPAENQITRSPPPPRPLRCSHIPLETLATRRDDDVLFWLLV